MATPSNQSPINIDRHVKYARWLGAKMAPTVGLTPDHAIAAALFGLAQAIDRFQPEITSFRRFARRRIAGAVLDESRSWNGDPISDATSLDWTIPDIQGDPLEGVDSVDSFTQLISPCDLSRRELIARVFGGETIKDAGRDMGMTPGIAQWNYTKGMGEIREEMDRRRARQSNESGKQTC